MLPTSLVPECEGPGMSAAWSGGLAGTGATRRPQRGLEISPGPGPPAVRYRSSTVFEAPSR
jgi:hypothetical protein